MATEDYEAYATYEICKLNAAIRIAEANRTLAEAKFAEETLLIGLNIASLRASIAQLEANVAERQAADKKDAEDRAARSAAAKARFARTAARKKKKQHDDQENTSDG